MCVVADERTAMIEDFEKVADAPEELVAGYEGLLPEEILDIWREHGLGTFYHGCLKVLDPREYQKLLEDTYWLGCVAIPVFATAFGDLITWEQNQFLGIVQYRYGDNDVISDGFEYFFEDLMDGDFDEKHLSMRTYNAAVKRYGSLAYGECFGYVPLLGLGGRETVNNLRKVKIREHIALIAQMVGRV